MKPAWGAADRTAAVLGTARGWRAAGLIDDRAFAAVTTDHPQPGPRLGWAWRILVFVCVAVGILAATALCFFEFRVRDAGQVAAILFAAGLALALSTDVVVERCAFRPTGAEAATSLLGVSYLAAAAFLLNDHLHLRGAPALRFALAWTAALLALAAWRWGFRLYAGAAVGAALLAAAQFPAPRLAWLAVAALLALAAGVALARREFSPSHRGGIELARAVALAAVYVAVNYYSTEQGWLEEIGRAVGAPHRRPGEMSLLLAGAGSVLFPAGIIAWGLRARARMLIDLGIVAAALSLATLRFYVHVAPLWLVLAAAGAALAGASLLLERWLGAGPSGERRGFTAAPLYDERQSERLFPVAAALAAAPEARALPDEPRGIDGKGGGFGGGGAGGGF
ncbi:MAG TPA: hypothetical protein VN317_09285 [Candidatus Methanoperedens sp.]|nr:hypothetical protein [Candidatus Methanoperedens sp.]